MTTSDARRPDRLMGVVWQGRRPLNAPRVVAAVALVLGLSLTVRAQDHKKADAIKARLVGAWEAEKGKGLVKGSTVRFGKDGKVTISVPKGEGRVKTEGTWRVDKGKVKLTLKRGDKERNLEFKPTTLDDKRLVLEDTEGGSVTFKKLGKAEKKDK
jgi:uncharacterized protein (TIGR03066 family)